jgi:hypothetical protein
MRSNIEELDGQIRDLKRKSAVIGFVIGVVIAMAIAKFWFGLL